MRARTTACCGCTSGLIIPEPREAVAIRIDGTVHHWDEGRALIFDDTFEHEARNESNHTRVVLFIDFERPLKFPGTVRQSPAAAQLFLPAVRARGRGDQGHWARRFYREAQAMREETRAATVREEAAARADGVAGRPRRLPAEKLTLAEALEREWPVKQA